MPATRAANVVPTARCRDHVASRPTWRCRACGTDWPCGRAKRDLLAEYGTRRTDLLVYLAILWEEALRQLTERHPGTGPAELHERFVGWLPPRTPSR
ncbi:flavin reductase [Micromonospora sp. NPDC047793]|uniref:flavin reductase n=1 Tax=unclassified Micromonospora TaxID=2617518 RepID=UPI0010349F63|nr:flavin reductase [Verrucosispora sp. SN26_14.1]TBL32006.1 flavin reductase [Verrucosispora sp. SN26_14.1]